MTGPARLPPAALAALLAAAPAAAPAAPARWEGLPGASRVEFVLHSFWHDVEGSTAAVAAELTSEGGDPLADGLVRVSVEAAALDTGIVRRDRKMREEHLEVAKHPLLEFRSTAPPRREAGAGAGAAAETAPARLVVEGDLAIHGVTRRVSVPVEARARDGGWLMTGAFVVRLSEFGIPDPSIALNKVRDAVDVRFEVRLSRREDP